MEQIETSLESQLDELLSEDIDSVKERESSSFDLEVATVRNSIVLFGAGSTGQRILARFREDGIFPLALSDNNRALWGKTVEGLIVLTPEEAARRFGKSAAFIVSIYNAGHSFVDTRRQLQDLGCERVLSVMPLRWKYHQSFLPYYRDDLPHKVCPQYDLVRRAFALWADDASRREYLAQVRWRLYGEGEGMAPPESHDQYFPEDFFQLSSEETFVDCGAYDGDTLACFLQHRGSAFRQAVAFEPDPSAFQSLQEYVRSQPSDIRARLNALPLAVGAEAGQVLFEPCGTSSAVSGSGSIAVQCMRLDDLSWETAPTYIKMDIEGAELDALAGARGITERHHPAFAVCVYHRQDHLWRVPLALHEMSDRYRFFLRPYMFEGWELVCYAVPAARLSI